ncbi:1-acyl-sn-glycerol-3-phosphate acyltransferase [Xenococcus sp. PCC 7305]|uniref:lysophospholipid acyltransferase family protein n=1 Tax=Xenococcus sp. PCC 7305 TaxID=102125 RepID=UPI0002AC3D47|nr:lysophospholipid acyltransferase family protein [Xenococcus sp. PCC 7305]ELS04392.1 1-acyl-sn-glycerol-3-phosphate acyltransferase [Xenococcus sp. PCC 7305]
MLFDTPLHISHTVLNTLGVKTSIHYASRIPSNKRILLVSNHRSFLDAPLLMSAINRPVRFACHHYMSQVPVMRELISVMGAFPLDAPNQRQKKFFRQSADFLQSQQTVGIFPEGAQPMVQVNAPRQISPFHRGFAHLAFRVPVQELAILPVAIASTEEYRHSVAPLKLFSLFDPSEPLFDCGGWHPAIVYRSVNILFGHPIWITEAQRQDYQGRRGTLRAKELTQSCAHQITKLLHQGC